MGEGALDGALFADHRNIKGSIDVFFQVGAANAAPINFDLDLVLLQKRRIGKFLNPNVLSLMPNHCFHLKGL